VHIIDNSNVHSCQAWVSCSIINKKAYGSGAKYHMLQYAHVSVRLFYKCRGSMDELTPSCKYINSKLTELTTCKHTSHLHSVRPSRERLTIGLLTTGGKI